MAPSVTPAVRAELWLGLRRAVELFVALRTVVSQPAGAANDRRGDHGGDTVLFHSDHYQLSEQFDGSTGYEKSVANLTWSYAAFLSAVRTRAATTT